MKLLDYVGLIKNYLSKRVFWGAREVLYGYPYLKHIIQSWSGYWFKHMAKNNEAVGMNNRLTMDGGEKGLVHNFIRQEFSKCISSIIC